MPFLGAHTSISGGLSKAVYRGRDTGCEVIQIFTRNNTRWASKPLTRQEIRSFHRAQEETGVRPVSAHDSYLINLASSSARTRRRSLHALKQEVERAERLGIPYLVMHPGAHVGDGEAEGLRRISQGLARLFEQLPRSEVRILLETTAGQGTSLGYRFEHLAEIMDRCGGRERLGICLDTCHVFAAGYDFRDATAYGRLMAGVDEIVGLHHLKVIHINDSKRDLGSRVDRHEHPGCGKIGQKGLSFFLRDIRLKNLPMLIETPKGRNKAGVDWDVINLNLLRKWMEDKQAR